MGQTLKSDLEEVLKDNFANRDAKRLKLNALRTAFREEAITLLGTPEATPDAIPETDIHALIKKLIECAFRENDLEIRFSGMTALEALVKKNRFLISKTFELLKPTITGALAWKNRQAATLFLRSLIEAEAPASVLSEILKLTETPKIESAPYIYHLAKAKIKRKAKQPRPSGDALRG